MRSIALIAAIAAATLTLGACSKGSEDKSGEPAPDAKAAASAAEEKALTADEAAAQAAAIAGEAAIAEQDAENSVPAGGAPVADASAPAPAPANPAAH